MGKRRVMFAGAALVVAGIGVGGIATAHGSHERFHVTINGNNEVPAADPDGRGKVKLDIDPEGGEVCFSLRFDRTGTPNRGHIHAGAAGVNGGIVVPLFELVSMPADERNEALERGRLEDCVPGDPTVLADIVANPQNYYANFHNARFPAGAIRGQVG
jgi:CHRD domain